MKTSRLLSYLLFAFLFLLQGCTREESGKTRIQFSIWGSVEQMQVERDIVASFEATHPDIQVDLLPIGGRYGEKIQAMMVGSVAPDVIMTEITQYFEWAARGVLLDVTPELDLLAAESEILPIPRKAFLYNNRAYAIPVNCHGPVLYYNKDILKAAGVEIPETGMTWAWIEDVSPKLSRRAGNPDAPGEYALILPTPVLLVWAWGGEIFDSNTHPTRVTIHSPETLAALKFIRRMVEKEYAVPPDIAADQGTYQLFRDGKIAFYFDGRWRTPDFAGQTDFDWDIAPMPAGPYQRITTHGGTGLGIYSKSRNIEAGKKFVRFYASKKGAERAMLGGRNVPIYREVIDSEAFLSLTPPPSIQYFAQTMEAGASSVPLYAPGSSEVSAIFFGRVEQVIAQRNLPIETIIEGMETELNRWLQKQQEKNRR